jgi:hypothetical protein
MKWRIVRPDVLVKSIPVERFELLEVTICRRLSGRSIACLLVDRHLEKTIG